ncbi:hypothetical protein CAEBREN_24199 [Caenorhabditis brenneri]|uniref:Serpentine Receptor, class H n=1 Tax=Caenorhabditis brenneri TaxID=135651 RepID=G0NF56_CAEBE|nr:hypothetical protein CAEBREN_24199 [Caenorhabditis brenneri]
MTESLEEYYSQKYSSCNLEYSFSASWQGLAYPSHVIKSIAIPIKALTVYIIIKRTPNHMKSLSIPLLVCHICCTILNLLFCTLATPYIFLRSLSGFGVGLFSWMGVPFKIQMIFGFFMLVVCTCSFIYLFENRSSTLQGNRFRITRIPSKVAYHGIVLALNCPIFYIFFKSPENQETAKLKVLEFDPCPTEEFFLSDVFVISTDKDLITLYVWGIGPFFLFNSVGHLIYHSFLTIYYLYIVPSKLISVQTQKMQRQFFIGIVFQTGIPLVFVGVPAGMAVVIYLTNCSCQGLVNSAILCLELHGLASSVTILLAYNVYRKSISDIFRIFSSSRNTGSLRISPVRLAKQTNSSNNNPAEVGR